MGREVAQMLLRVLMFRRAVGATTEGQPGVDAYYWVRKHIGQVSAAEMSALMGDIGATRAALHFHWKAEWAHVLAWALGLRDDVPTPDVATDFQWYDTLPQYPKDPATFLEQATLKRSAIELAEMAKTLALTRDEWLAMPAPPTAQVDLMTSRSRAQERAGAAAWLVEEAMSHLATPNKRSGASEKTG